MAKRPLIKSVYNFASLEQFVTGEAALNVKEDVIVINRYGNGSQTSRSTIDNTQFLVTVEQFTEELFRQNIFVNTEVLADSGEEIIKVTKNVIPGGDQEFFISAEKNGQSLNDYLDNLEASIPGPGLQGSGTTNRIALWTDTNELGDSIIKQTSATTIQMLGTVTITSGMAAASLTAVNLQLPSGSLTGHNIGGTIQSVTVGSGLDFNDSSLTLSVDSSIYEPPVTAGATTDYYRGDKTFQDLDTAVGALGYVKTSGISEAPTDGQQYGRQSSSWTVIIPGISEAPADGNEYARKDNAWVVVTTGGSGIPDAPADNNTYGRNNNAWVVIPEATTPSLQQVTDVEAITTNNLEISGTEATQQVSIDKTDASTAGALNLFAEDSAVGIGSSTSKNMVLNVNDIEVLSLVSDKFTVKPLADFESDVSLVSSNATLRFSADSTGGIFNSGTTGVQGIKWGSGENWRIESDANSYIKVHATDGTEVQRWTNTLSTFTTRVAGVDAANPTEFVTKKQLEEATQSNQTVITFNSPSSPGDPIGSKDFYVFELGPKRYYIEANVIVETDATFRVGFAISKSATWPGEGDNFTSYYYTDVPDNATDDEILQRNISFFYNADADDNYYFYWFIASYAPGNANCEILAFQAGQGGNQESSVRITEYN